MSQGLAESLQGPRETPSGHVRPEAQALVRVDQNMMDVNQILFYRETPGLRLIGYATLALLSPQAGILEVEGA